MLDQPRLCRLPSAQVTEASSDDRSSCTCTVYIADLGEAQLYDDPLREMHGYTARWAGPGVGRGAGGGKAAGWVMDMMAWVLSIKVLELQSDDLLRCACQPAELPLRQQRVEGMVVSAQQALQVALSGFLTASCPPQEQLIPQLAGVARPAAELQQQCAILLLLAAPDPLAALDDLPPAGAAFDGAQAAHGPKALLQEHQQAWLQAAVAPAAVEHDVLPAAAVLGGPPAPIAEPAQPPELPAAAAAPAPVPARGICQAAPLASPFPATSGEAVAASVTDAAAGRQQEQDATAGAAGEQQPGGAAGTAPMQESSDEAEAMPRAQPLVPLQPQQPRPASRGQAAPAAAASAAKPYLTSVSEVLRFMDSVPKHSRSPLLMDRLKARSPHESAHAALETIEEEGPVLSAQQVVPQAGPQLLGGGAANEQQPGHATAAATAVHLPQRAAAAACRRCWQTSVASCTSVGGSPQSLQR